MSSVYLVWHCDLNDYAAGNNTLARAEAARRTRARADSYGASLTFDPGDLASGVRNVEISGDPLQIAALLAMLHAQQEQEPCLPDSIVVDANEWAATDSFERETLEKMVKRVGLKLSVE